MDRIFAALGHPVRLGIVLQLAVTGPLRQTELLAALNEAKVAGREMHRGEMTQLLRPLFETELIARDSPRGAIRLTGRQQIQRLLTTASALNVAAATYASEDATRGHAELMRQIATEVSDNVDAG